MESATTAIPLKTKVTVHGDIPGVVHGILITEDGISYKVCWWSGRERKEEWLWRHEFEVSSFERTKIGWVQE